MVTTGEGGAQDAPALQRGVMSSEMSGAPGLVSRVSEVALGQGGPEGTYRLEAEGQDRRDTVPTTPRGY